MSVDPLLQSVLDMMSGDMFLPANANKVLADDEPNEVRDLFYGEEE